MCRCRIVETPLRARFGIAARPRRGIDSEHQRPVRWAMRHQQVTHLGGIDAAKMRNLLVAHRPADWPLVFAVDASTWARCDAETSPERGFYYSASTHSAGKPIVAG